MAKTSPMCPGRRQSLQLQCDQLNMVVFFFYLVKVTCPVYATVHVYTGYVTFSRVPEKHGHV